MREVAIVGVGSTVFGKLPEKLPYELGAEAARAAGLGVNAGHDLNCDNLPAFVAAVETDEVSIGHALIADALELGYDATVKAYLKALGR